MNRATFGYLSEALKELNVADERIVPIEYLRATAGAAACDQNDFVLESIHAAVRVVDVPSLIVAGGQTMVGFGSNSQSYATPIAVVIILMRAKAFKF